MRIQALQDYFILIGAGIIENSPDTLYGNTNDTLMDVVIKRLGFKAKVGSYGGVTLSTSVKELRERVFSPRMNRMVERLQPHVEFAGVRK
jgi:hypothetical protein